MGSLPARLWESSHYVSLMSQTEVPPTPAAGAPFALLAGQVSAHDMGGASQVLGRGHLNSTAKQQLQLP